MANTKWFITVKYCLSILSLLGLYPKRCINYGFNIYTGYTCLILITVFLDIFCQTVHIFFNLDDVNTLAATIYTLPEKYIVLAKAYQLIYYRKQFQDIIQEVHTAKFQPVNKTQTVLRHKSLKMFKIFFSVYSGSVVTTIFLSALYPILDKTEKKQFFSQAWYPYNSKISPFYEITYVHQCISLYIIAGVIVGVDLFICFQNIFIGCQFDMLCNKLRRSTEQNFINCIKSYRDILRFDRY